MKTSTSDWETMDDAPIEDLLKLMKRNYAKQFNTNAYISFEARALHKAFIDFIKYRLENDSHGVL